MAKGSVFVISETTPDISVYFPTIKDKYIWLKPIPDGSFEYYEATTSGWVKVLTIPAFALASHSHPEVGETISAHAALSDVHHPANAGITGSKTIGGYKFTFTNGLLTGFEPV